MFEKMLSLRASALKWRGNPPVERNQVTITTKNRKVSRSVGQLSIHFPSNWGIATPVCALARNDSKYSTNTNLSVCLRKPITDKQDVCITVSLFHLQFPEQIYCLYQF